MKHIIFIFLILFLLSELGFSQQTQDGYVLNTSSENEWLFFEVPLQEFKNFDSNFSSEFKIDMTKGGKTQTYPARIIGQDMVFLLPLKPHESASVKIDVSSPETTYSVGVKHNKKNGSIIVKTLTGEYSFNKNGLNGYKTGESDLSFDGIKGCEETVLLEENDLYVKLETKKNGKREVVWTVFFDGTVKGVFFNKNSFFVGKQGEQMQGWRFGPYDMHRKIGYHLERCPHTLEEMMIVEPVNEVKFKEYLEWGACLKKGKGAGLGFAADQKVTYYPHGKLRKPHGTNPSGERLNGYVEVNASSDNPVKLTIRGQKSLDEVKIWQNTKGSALFVRKGENGNVWSGSVPGYSKILVIKDYNGNGHPDMKGDRWIFTRKNGDVFLMYEFVPYKNDPREEGNAFLIYNTKEKDMKKIKWERPNHRFSDWNRDGIYFRGNLLYGGRLEQDMYYERRSGSPDGKLWDTRYGGMDFDGDGDFDAEIFHRGLNFHDDGWGTFRLDLEDHDYAPVMVIDLNGPKYVIKKAIDYDTGQPFSYKASHNNAYLHGDGYWRVTEEHYEIEGFVEGTRVPQAHLWTFGGSHSRTIFGGIANGNWKLGVRNKGRKALFHGKPREITWADPWGHEFKFASMLYPDHWDGKEMKFTLHDGHLDYENFTPWINAVEQSIEAEAVIWPPNEFGVVSGEAYVHLETDRGRLENSLDGKTSHFFYYSPLMRSLHHRGMYEGYNKKNQLIYFDEDEDGIVDTYLFDTGLDRTYDKILTYDHKKGQLWFTDGDRTVTWEEKFEFPGARMYLENFKKIENLYTRGMDSPNEPPVPVVENMEIQNGKLKGYEAKVTPDDETYPLVDALYLSDDDMLYEDYLKTKKDQGYFGTEYKHEFAFHVMNYNFARNRIRPQMTSAFPGKEELEGKKLAVIAKITKKSGESKVAALGQWVKDGGTLYLGVSGTNEFEKHYANAVLEKMGLDMRLSDERVNKFFRNERIPDNGHIEGDVAGEVVPSPANRAEHFSGKDEFLKDIEYINFASFYVDGFSSALLLYKDQPVIAEEMFGKGRVVLAGGPFLSRKGSWHPLHVVYFSSNNRLVRNIIKWLAALSRSDKK